MKNKVKLIVCIIIMILISGVSVYATYNYLAKDINYVKSNGENISVQDALDELYNKKRDLETSVMGYISVNSDLNGGWYRPYQRDSGDFEGYGPSDTSGWYANDGLVNAYSSYNYSKKVCVTHARVAYGVGNDDTWVKEGYLTIQASNDYFSNEVVDIATIHLEYDKELLKIGKYAVFWDGDIQNNNEYFSYRVIAKDASGFTGTNKLQLSCIRYTIK